MYLKYSLYQTKEIINIVYINSGNSKSSNPHRLLLNLLYKINLKRSGKYVAVSNLSIYYIWKNFKKSHKNNKFKIASALNEKFELPDWSYSVSDMQDYFEYIIKKYQKVTDNPPIRIHVNKIENGIIFRLIIIIYFTVQSHLLCVWEK